MTKVKICGITTLEDAKLAAEAGATYLGLNFYPESPRYLAPDEATELGVSIKTDFPTIKLVGVFVNESKENIKRIANPAKIDIIQLHGDEDPAFADSFELPVWKAFRIATESSLSRLNDYQKLAGIMFDAYRQGQFGGTGVTANWELIKKVRKEVPFCILAGGLNPENVAEAIRELRPDVIDLASGVESNDPRRKDPKKIKALQDKLRHVLDRRPITSYKSQVDTSQP